jgi:hypothetical protein
MPDERTVGQLVDETKAIRWWIDKQIADGKDDAWIEAVLPLAIQFITGRISGIELQAILDRARAS